MDELVRERCKGNRLTVLLEKQWTTVTKQYFGSTVHIPRVGRIMNAVWHVRVTILNPDLKGSRGLGIDSDQSDPFQRKSVDQYSWRRRRSCFRRQLTEKFPTDVSSVIHAKLFRRWSSKESSHLNSQTGSCRNVET